MTFGAIYWPMNNISINIHFINEHYYYESDLADVADDDLTDENLVALAATQDREFVLALDAALQPAELPLLGVVVEGRHEDDDDDRYQNGQAFNPFVVFALFVSEFLC